MKIILKSSLIVSLLAALFFTACKKDPQNTGNLENLYEDLAIQPITVTFDATDYFYFKTADQGTIIQLTANSLVDKNGNPVTGNVEANITVITKKGDIIRAARPTQTTDNEPIETAGEVLVEMFQNDEKLSLAPGKKLRIQFEAENPVNDMRLFYGTDGPVESNAWVLQNNAIVNLVAPLDSMQNDLYYELFCDSMIWINCDRFFSVPSDQKTTVNVVLPDGLDNENTAIYLVYHDLNSVINSRTESDDKYSFSNCIVNEKATLVVISQKEKGNYLLDHQAVTISKDLSVELAPASISLKDLQDFLQTL